jgi:hypothetical protein
MWRTARRISPSVGDMSHFMTNPLARQRQVYANLQDSRPVSPGHTIRNKILFLDFCFEREVYFLLVNSCTSRYQILVLIRSNLLYFCIQIFLFHAVHYIEKLNCIFVQ